MWQNIVVVY